MEGTVKVKSTWARGHFGQLMDQVSVQRQRVRVTRRGQAEGVAMVPLEDLELLEALEDRLDLKDALAAIKEIEAGQAVRLEDLEKALGL